MGNRGKKSADDDEVEQLLRAAHDDMLLNLSVNSHMARAAAVDPDLDRRFQALKKPRNPTKTDDSTKSAPTKPDTGDHKVAGVAAADDDLFARFAALKNSLPCYSGNGNKSNFASDESAKQVAEDDNDDEVEKVIKWATDAARLDPSPPSEDDDDDDDDDEEEDDEDDERVERGKKGRRK